MSKKLTPMTLLVADIEKLQGQISDILLNTSCPNEKLEMMLKKEIDALSNLIDTSIIRREMLDGMLEQVRSTLDQTFELI